MNPALYRRPVAYWAAPEMEYISSAPTYTRPHANYFEWRLLSEEQLSGCFFSDGLIAIFWDKFIGFYEIN